MCRIFLIHVLVLMCYRYCQSSSSDEYCSPLYGSTAVLESLSCRPSCSHAKFVFKGKVALDALAFDNADERQLNRGIRHFLSLKIAPFFGIVHNVDGEFGRVRLEVLEHERVQSRLNGSSQLYRG